MTGLLLCFVGMRTLEERCGTLRSDLDALFAAAAKQSKIFST